MNAKYTITINVWSIDLSPVKYNYPFIISLDNCNESCNNAVDGLCAKVYVSSKTKDKNISV